MRGESGSNLIYCPDLDSKLVEILQLKKLKVGKIHAISEYFVQIP